MNWLNEYELPILWWIREHLTHPFLDTVMPYLTSLADHGEFWILLAVILLCFKETRKAGVAMGIAMACGYLIGNMGMKNLFARTRPYDMVEVELLVAKLHDFSFPSGHTLVSVEAAVARFRLVPPQDTAEPFVLEHIARESLKQVEGGWSWKFDNLRMGREGRGSLENMTPRSRLAYFRSEHGIVDDALAAKIRRQLGPDTLMVELPAAGHHPMIDQPLAVVTAARTVLAGWEG